MYEEASTNAVMALTSAIVPMMGAGLFPATTRPVDIMVDALTWWEAGRHSRKPDLIAALPANVQTDLWEICTALNSRSAGGCMSLAEYLVAEFRA